MKKVEMYFLKDVRVVVEDIGKGHENVEFQRRTARG